MIEIDNKYNLGDTLWRMYENKPTAYIVESIEFKLIDGKRLLYYSVHNLSSMYIETCRGR